jgi:hypothetical protein
MTGVGGLVEELQVLALKEQAVPLTNQTKNYQSLVQEVGERRLLGSAESNAIDGVVVKPNLKPKYSVGHQSKLRPIIEMSNSRVHAIDDGCLEVDSLVGDFLDRKIQT